MSSKDESVDELLTVRDWLRYAVSRFNAAGLVYGHGSERALDEAAFLILAGLDLDVDELDPWLEARLTRAERMKVAGLIEQRVSTRKPAAYLVGCGYIRGRRFIVDERAIVPRSYIGELLCGEIDGDGMFPPLAPEAPIERILDLCTGGGSLAILAALAFPEAEVDAVEISPDALALAQENVALYGLAERVRLLRGDLYEPLGDRRYDLIITNPPYVTEQAVAAFPPEYRSEPRLAHLGGADGLDIVRRIVSGAGRHLQPHGQIVIEIGDAAAAFQASFPGLAVHWVETERAHDEVVAIAAADLADGAGRGAKGRRRGAQKT